MKHSTIAIVLLFAILSSAANAESITLNGYNIIFNIPDKYPSIRSENSLAFIKQTPEYKVGIDFVFTSYDDLGKLSESELSIAINKIRRDEGRIQYSCLLEQINLGKFPLLITLDPYFKISHISRIADKSGHYGEEKYEISSCDENEMMNPFIFEAEIALSRGLLCIQVINFDLNEKSFISAMKKYGKVEDGSLIFDNQSQIDSIFDDLIAGKLKDYAALNDSYKIYRQIIDTLCINKDSDL